MTKEPVCCCKHVKSWHVLGGCELCNCKRFTDKRISNRRAASKATREAGSKSEVEKLLESYRLPFWRMQSGDIIQQLGGRRQRIRGNKKGTPDYLVFYLSCVGICNATSWGDWCCQHTHVLWLETKCTSGKLSKEQLEFKSKAEARGEIYLMPRSAEEVKQWLEENL